MRAPKDVEERAREMIASLRGFRAGRLRARGFRLNYGEATTATLGIHDSKKGSVYSPLQVVSAVRGGFLVEWSDGRVSRGSIDGNTGGDLHPLLAASLKARYRDDDSRQFLGRTTRVPDVAIHDRAMEAIVAGRFGLLYDLVDLVFAGARALHVRKVSGTVFASVGASVIATSAGLFHSGRSSEFSFAFGFDSELWDGRSSRRPIRVPAARKAIDLAASLLPYLRRKVRPAATGTAGAVSSTATSTATTTSTGTGSSTATATGTGADSATSTGTVANTGTERRVLILPRFAEELIEAYVVGNLYGAEVATGQSAFRPDDFRKRKQVFRSDLQLHVDPTVPYSSGSYRITSEGVPAHRETYVEDGRLARPIVGLKYARRLGVRPTTPPASMESVVLEARRAIPYRRALAALGDGGLMLLSALGLHTQDTTSGDFSLTAPQAILVKAGRPRASCKAVIAGNLFAMLNHETTELVRVAGYRFPGLLVTCHVKVS